MLGSNRRRLELAYSLQLTMPGTPVIRYGDEIGMGEDLTLPEREAIRTPMQWYNSPNAGFSEADPDRLISPVISEGDYGYAKVNVTDQRLDPHSLLTWFERILHTRRECEEIGPPHVLVHTATGERGKTLFLHNLTDRACRVALDHLLGEQDQQPPSLAADDVYGDQLDLSAIDLNEYGYRWIKLRRSA